MSKRRTKKLNPRRIPIAKSMINQDQILEEATKDDLYHAWLLVFCSMIELNYIELQDIPELTERVNKYISNSHFHGDEKGDEIEHAESIMGIPVPHASLHINHVKSAIELESFKRKVTRIALHTALCVLCLGLESTRLFTQDDLHHLFLGVDLTIAEIEHGITSFSDLENSLVSIGLTVEKETEDLHHVLVTTQS